MLISYCIFNAMWLFVWQYFAHREISISIPMFLRDVLPYMLLAAAVMCLTHIFTVSIDNLYVLLLSRMTIAACLYISASYILRSEELHEIICFLFKRKKQA